jgi:hypothetical protein
LRFVFLIIALVTGAASGLGLTWLLSSQESAFAALRIGAWQAWLKSGTAEADPYTRAAYARSGELPVGLGEGIAFRAVHDDAGRALDGRCITRIRGRVLPARFWTLSLYDEHGRLIDNTANRYAFTSAEIVFEVDGQFEIRLAPRALPGNWLPTGDVSHFSVVFRFYDTPTGVTARSEAAEMPKIEQERCP